jgi:hypothetical protein
LRDENRHLGDPDDGFGRRDPLPYDKKKGDFE